MEKADADFGMISEGDKILIPVNDHKFSLAFVKLMKVFAARKGASIIAMLIDRKTPGLMLNNFTSFFKKEKVEFEIVEKVEGERITSQVCVYARKNDCNVIARPGTFDDLILEYLDSTLLKGEKKILMARQNIKNGGIKIVRPLILCHNETVQKYLDECDAPRFEIHANLFQKARELLSMQQLVEPHVKDNLFKALLPELFTKEGLLDEEQEQNTVC